MSSVRIRPGTLSIKKKDRITPTFFLTPSRPPASGGSRAPCALSHMACASLFYARRFCAFLLIRPILSFLPPPVPPASGGSRAPCALSPVFRPLPSPLHQGEVVLRAPYPLFSDPSRPLEGEVVLHAPHPTWPALRCSPHGAFAPFFHLFALNIINFAYLCSVMVYDC